MFRELFEDLFQKATDWKSLNTAMANEHLRNISLTFLDGVNYDQKYFHACWIEKKLSKKQVT